MRSLVIVALVACSPGAREVPDAPSPTDAAPEQEPDRQVNRVIVGDEMIIWSHGEFVCSLEFGCPMFGPGLTYWHRATDTVATWIDGGVGARTVVGVERELYLVTGADYGEMYLRRLGGAGNLNMSIPRPLSVGPAIDATHVYWGDSIEPFNGYTLRRTSRTGDGSDATVVLTASEATRWVDQLTYAAGHLWWIDASQSVVRVPVAGGAVEYLPVDAVTITAIDDVVYVGGSRSNGDGTWTEEIGRFAPDSSYEPLAERPSAGSAPRYIVRADNETYWSSGGDGNLYHATDGGPVLTIDAQTQGGYVFAVLADGILVEFNRTGFRTIAR